MTEGGSVTREKSLQEKFGKRKRRQLTGRQKVARFGLAAVTGVTAVMAAQEGRLSTVQKALTDALKLPTPSPEQKAKPPTPEGHGFTIIETPEVQKIEIRQGPWGNNMINMEVTGIEPDPDQRIYFVGVWNKDLADQIINEGRPYSSLYDPNGNPIDGVYSWGRSWFEKNPETGVYETSARTGQEGNIAYIFTWTGSKDGPTDPNTLLQFTGVVGEEP
jgi:hypothetical protein